MSNLLTVSEAAEILRIHKQTLRNWMIKGHIKCVKHPINGYNLYNREEIEELARKINKSKIF